MFIYAFRPATSRSVLLGFVFESIFKMLLKCLASRFIHGAIVWREANFFRRCFAAAQTWHSRLAAKTAHESSSREEKSRGKIFFPFEPQFTRWSRKFLRLDHAVCVVSLKKELNLWAKQSEFLSSYRSQLISTLLFNWEKWKIFRRFTIWRLEAAVVFMISVNKRPLAPLCETFFPLQVTLTACGAESDVTFDWLPRQTSWLSGWLTQFSLTSSWIRDWNRINVGHSAVTSLTHFPHHKPTFVGREIFLPFACDSYDFPISRLVAFLPSSTPTHTRLAPVMSLDSQLDAAVFI